MVPTYGYACARSIRRASTLWRAGLAALASLALAAGLMSSGDALAADDADAGAAAVQPGSFGVGDGLEATIDESQGAFGFTLDVGGLRLAWDSRAIANDRHGFGAGWALGLTAVRASGGVLVFPAGGGAFEADRSAPTGLAGYPGADVMFEVAEAGAELPERADGVAATAAFAYMLHELGGEVTYFDAAGDPVAQLSADGRRADWRWAPDGTHRLVAAVDQDGAMTRLDWSDDEVVVVPGANVSHPREGSGTGGAWRIALDGARRVSAVTDPVGRRTEVGYGTEGLVRWMLTPSGAATQISWRSSLDAVARIEHVSVSDAATGRELSRRHWSGQGDATPTGWPVVAGTGSTSWASEGTGAWVREAVLTDGATRVVTRFDGRHRVTHRATTGSSAAGERVLQEQSFTYPAKDETSAGELVRTRPETVTVSHRNERGERRDVTESYTFDGLGRMVTRTAADGTTTRRVYDSAVPAGRRLPVGLVVEETTSAPDGLVASTVHELSADRANVVATERRSGRDGTLTRSDRAEYDVDRGFVRERRAYPGGDPSATPIVTVWSARVDLATGTRTVAERAAAGTSLETSVIAVSSLVHGATLSSTDQLGTTTIATFDAAGRLVAVRDAAGHEATHAYRTAQTDGINAVTVTGVDGVSVTDVSDPIGRVIRRFDDIGPAGEVVEGHERVFETHEYTGDAVERVTDAWGASTTTERDVYGRPIRVTLPTGLVQLAEHDEVAGTATSGVSPTGRLTDAELRTTVHLDELGRVTGTDTARGDGVPVPSVATEFDGFGRETRVDDGVVATSTEYDVFGNAVSTELRPAESPSAAVGPGAGLCAERRFDPRGVSLEKTLRSGDESRPGERRELDLLGRVVSVTDQRGTTERMTYTPDGLVERAESDTGRVTTFDYDPVTRALTGTRVTSPSGPAVSTSYERDAAGRVTAVFDPADRAGTEIASDLDAFGNTTRVRYPDGSEVRHEFDRHGRLAVTIDVAGNRTARTYDPADGTLIAVAQHDRHGTLVGRVEYDYDDFGRVRRIVRPTGVVTEVGFTSAGEIATERTTGPRGVLSEREYAYSPAGDLVERVDRVADEQGALAVTSTTYEYDLLGRLLRSTVRAASDDEARVTKTSEYTASIAGDLGAEVVTLDPGTAAAETTTREFEYSETGELTEIVVDGLTASQRFDADGALVVAADGAKYSHDAAGRVTTQVSPDGRASETRYWADGTRRELVDEAGSTRFYWDGGALVNEVHASAAGDIGTASYLIGTGRHARVTQGGDDGPITAYYGVDRHGNVTELTDARGEITIRYAYTDYGVATTTGPAVRSSQGAGRAALEVNPFQYASAYTFADGSQSLGSRIYLPGQARFGSKDPEALANRYAFADLNPVMLVDPTGRAPERDWLNAGLVIGGFVGSVVGALVMLGSGGAALAGVGAAGLVMAGGDIVIAGFQVADLFGEVSFFDEEMTAIASWTLFTVGIGFTIGGLASKAAAHVARRGARAARPAEPTKVGAFVTPESDAEIGMSGGTRSRAQSEEELRALRALQAANQRVSTLEEETQRLDELLKARHGNARALGAKVFDVLSQDSDWLGASELAKNAIDTLPQARVKLALENLVSAEVSIRNARQNAASLLYSTVSPDRDELVSLGNDILGAVMIDHLRNANDRLGGLVKLLGSAEQSSTLSVTAVKAIGAFRTRIAPFVPAY